MSAGARENEGLRARKQRETRNAIHRAAVDLALEHGPDGATVAAISDRADISVRTFFNYYPTKEDAIVGLHEGLPSDAELDEFRTAASGDLISDLSRLLLGVYTPDDDDLVAQRRSLIVQYPYLIQRQWVRMHGVEQRTATAVAERMRTAGDFSHLDDIDAAAEILVMTCSGALRLSIRKTIEHGGQPADVLSRLDESLHTLREVLRTLP
ncbi:TetR/AcrR family transcriptional regulator [Microbacterium invictum]|uniref:AcrR family transcriptional regulator n=1 Tax=Microbacterium invictum TaxID=515415 RepID=A0AA40SQ75_9MICO|nr:MULTISPECIES: TetR/AcrR family transcriptional regulator [Microbacterium]MBB4140235.1 AcrR family transcriptional regulator [Microbacterium invictum]